MNPSYNIVPPKVRFDWISQSWQLFCAQWSIWVPAILISGVINTGILGAVAYELGIFNNSLDTLRAMMAHPHTPSAWAPPPGSHSDPVGQLLFDGVAWVLSAFFYGGLFRMSNKQVRGESIAIGDVFSGGSTFLTMLGFVIVLGLLANVGACCFCVGMLVVYALFWPGLALIADGVGFGEAFSRSFEAMKQDWFRASLYVLVFGLIMLASFIPLGLGLLITSPMSYLSTSLAYRDMIGMPGMPGAPGARAGFDPSQWPPPPSGPTGPDASPPQGT